MLLPLENSVDAVEQVADTEGVFSTLFEADSALAFGNKDDVFSVKASLDGDVLLDLLRYVAKLVGEIIFIDEEDVLGLREELGLFDGLGESLAPLNGVELFGFLVCLVLELLIVLGLRLIFLEVDIHLLLSDIVGGDRPDRVARGVLEPLDEALDHRRFTRGGDTVRENDEELVLLFLALSGGSLVLEGEFLELLGGDLLVSEVLELGFDDIYEGWRVLLVVLDYFNGDVVVFEVLQVGLHLVVLLLELVFYGLLVLEILFEGSVVDFPVGSLCVCSGLESFQDFF